jgi:hypothetical protein
LLSEVVAVGSTGLLGTLGVIASQSLAMMGALSGIGLPLLVALFVCVCFHYLVSYPFRVFLSISTWHNAIWA